jgi:hypothetical protein
MAAPTAAAGQSWLMSYRHISLRSRVRPDQHHSGELLAFRQFRSNIISFLRLPHDVSESALRSALNTVSPTLLAGYKHRAAQATLAWASMWRTDMQSLRPREETQDFVQPHLT